MSNTLASKVKSDIHSWKIQNSINYANMVKDDPSIADYIIDIMADTSLEELDDEKLARVVSGCTAKNLASLGYPGSRSNTGETITPFHTVLLYAIGQEFGWDQVRLGVFGNGFRGFRNTTEIRKFYAEEVQRLIRRLTIQSVASES